MNNDITELRSVLFDTLRDLRAGKMDAAQARSINNTAQTLINSAKLEVEHLKVVGGTGTGFVSSGIDRSGELPKGITGVTRHTLAG